MLLPPKLNTVESTKVTVLGRWVRNQQLSSAHPRLESDIGAAILLHQRPVVISLGRLAVTRSLAGL